jgi:hypothetical protein
MLQYIVVDNNLKAEIYNKGMLLKVRLTSVNKESITNVNDLNSLVKQVDDFIKNSTDNKNSDKERNSVRDHTKKSSSIRRSYTGQHQYPYGLYKKNVCQQLEIAER